MTERDEALRALHIGVGTVSPEHAASEGYVKGIQQVQKTMRQQGHVMSEALSNNAALWEHKKKIETENMQLKGQNESLRISNDHLRRELSNLKEAYAKLEAQGGDRYKTLYEESRRTINLYLSDALDEDQLQQRLEAMKQQKQALDAEGIKAPALPSRDAIDAHMEDEGIADLGDL